MTKTKKSRHKTEHEKSENAGNKEQLKNENKVLKTVMLVIGLIVLAFTAYMIFSYFTANFEYKGVKFSTVPDEWVGVLYNTKVPVVYNGTDVDYNFYLRKDPRTTTREVDFDGELVIKPLMVINTTGDLNCNGDGVIAGANLLTLYKAIGTTAGKAPNATCDSLGRYVYVNIEESNETRIIETSPACYTIKVSECQILEATERYMIETFVEIKKITG
ncbi:MAG: hypothetical protein PHH00_00805 [Candidatus Nanoarchaeia archaeon]|nr:hypothetical protein [Candidatus Nanoarchaeia archaeon]